MAEKGVIMGRIKARRKDKELITFTDYKGESKTDKYAPIMTIWANKFGGGDAKVDKNVSDAQLKSYLTSGDYYVQFFPQAAATDDGF